MDADIALKIIQSLRDGRHPDTDEALPQDSMLHHAEVVRALFIATQALERVREMDRRRALFPRHTGLPWSREEDNALLARFDSGMGLEDIAMRHERTYGAIQARLAKLGKISAPIDGKDFHYMKRSS